MVSGQTLSGWKSDPALKPMPVWESLVYLTVVNALILFCFYAVRPFLEKMGLNPYAAYLSSLSLVAVLMLVWAIIYFYREGNQPTWETFRQRLRLKGLLRGEMGLSLGLGIFMFLMTILFSPLISRLIVAGLLPIPGQIPDYINPLVQMSVAQIKAQFISQGVIFFIPFVLILNILAEEFFWRGIVFPRQELQHGKDTFLVHGTIWAVAHLFQYWLIPPILISSLALSYIIQKKKNTTISIVAHLVNNGLPFVIMLFIPV